MEKKRGEKREKIRATRPGVSSFAQCERNRACAHNRVLAHGVLRLLFAFWRLLAIPFLLLPASRLSSSARLGDRKTETKLRALSHRRERGGSDVQAIPSAVRRGYHKLSNYRDSCSSRTLLLLKCQTETLSHPRTCLRFSTRP